MANELFQDAAGQGADDAEPIWPEPEQGNRPDGEPGNRLLPPARRRPRGNGKGWFPTQAAERSRRVQRCKLERGVRPERL
jgi:hypothetical protein